MNFTPLASLKWLLAEIRMWIVELREEFLERKFFDSLVSQESDLLDFELQMVYESIDEGVGVSDAVDIAAHVIGEMKSEGIL